MPVAGSTWQVEVVVMGSIVQLAQAPQPPVARGHRCEPPALGVAEQTDTMTSMSKELRGQKPEQRPAMHRTTFSGSQEGFVF